MNAINRKQYILTKLRTDGSVSITVLADELKVSSMTIRRDLNMLSKNGLLTLMQGGAVLNNDSNFEHNMVINQEIKAAEKAKIARKCLEYIKDGDCIFLDTGTTVNKIASLLDGKRNVVVLTNSLLAAHSISNLKNSVEIIMCPGKFRKVSMAYIGSLTNVFVSQFQIDTLFLGVSGIDLDNGISVLDITDGATKRVLIKRARKVICVADSSKFNRTFLYSIAPLSKVDLIITDSGLDKNILNQYIQNNIQVITV